MNLRGSVKAEAVVTPVRNATFVYGPDLGVSEPEKAKGTLLIGSDMSHLPLIPSQRAHVIHMRTGKTAPQLQLSSTLRLQLVLLDTECPQEENNSHANRGFFRTS